jgi:poly-gamma-glutamate capsule biosynthesis protein CapA/YwtB (metallophosphatase superfamily)
VTHSAGTGRPRWQRATAAKRGRITAIVVAIVWLAAMAIAVYGLLRSHHAQAAATSPSHTPAATSKPAPSTSPSARAVVGRHGTVSITWVGDMTFGTLGRYPAGGSASLLTGVASQLRSELTDGNLETALGTRPLSKCAPHEANCYAFEAPVDTATALRQAGFAAVNVANNHTMDAGPAGEQSTDAALKAAHLRYAGRPGQITYLRRGGFRIALLGFAPWPYDANLLDIAAARKLVHRAKEHARLVIVIIHAGAEGVTAQHVRPGMETYLGEQRGNSIAFTHAVINAGADLVMGSGPHVLRAMQWYHGHLIAYSLGNFCGYYTLSLNGVQADSAILHVTLRSNGTFVSGSITPIVLTGSGTPQLDPGGAAIRLINSLSADDFGGRGAVRITRTGKIRRQDHRKH